ncbi:hypothetical protein DAI22_07g090850 [Oryza sativa Japonica Group]|nr:hypothetical protein DAI22_07g090850 [Oryza sativa Japonica Group]
MPRGLKFLNFRKYGKFRTEISGLTEPSCRLFNSYFSATFPPILGVSSTIIAAAAAAAGGSPHPFSGQPVDLSVSFSAPCPTRWGPSKLQDDNMQIHHFLRTGKAQHRNAASHGCATKPFHPLPAVDLYKVKLVSPKGVEHEFDAPGDACILDSAETAGLELPYSCRAGDCSTCAGRIEDGVVDQPNGSYLDDAQRADGYVLTCVSYPRSNCVIHTHKGREV